MTELSPDGDLPALLCAAGCWARVDNHDRDLSPPARLLSFRCTPLSISIEAPTNGREGWGAADRQGLADGGVGPRTGW